LVTGFGISFSANIFPEADTLRLHYNAVLYNVTYILKISIKSVEIRQNCLDSKFLSYILIFR